MPVSSTVSLSQHLHSQPAQPVSRVKSAEIAAPAATVGKVWVSKSQQQTHLRPLQSLTLLGLQSQWVSYGTSWWHHSCLAPCMAAPL